MAWTDVNFNDVNPGQELVQAGEYTFRLTGAQRNKFDLDAFDLRAEIVTEGPYNGEKMYIRFPNPDKAGKGVPASDPRNWVNKSFKRFQDAIGYDIPQGDHPVEFVNRIVGDVPDGIFFEAKVVHETYNDKDTGDPITKHKVTLSSIRKTEAVTA